MRQSFGFFAGFESAFLASFFGVSLFGSWESGERGARIFQPRVEVEEPADPGEEPTEEEVAKMHAEYVDAVVRLFEEHKEAAGYGPEETLRVI